MIDFSISYVIFCIETDISQSLKLSTGLMKWKNRLFFPRKLRVFNSCLCSAVPDDPRVVIVKQLTLKFADHPEVTMALDGEW